MSSSQALTDPSQHLFWLASRSLGVIAMLLVSAAVACGLALSGRLSHRPGASAWLKTAHEALTLTSLGAIAGHGLLLLGDPYLHPGISGITLPFALAAQSAWTGIGIATWRWLHRWTLLAYVMCLAHSIGSGTDASSPWMLVLLGAATVPVLAIGTVRLRGVLGARREPGSGAPGAPRLRTGV